MIHEILLALTGLPSTIIGAQLDDAVFHPSEQKLFVQVHEFSHVVRQVSQRISQSQKQISHQPEGTAFQRAILIIKPAIVNVFDTLVLTPYLKEIAKTEHTILTRDSQLMNGPDIIPLSTLIASTVNTWKRRFDYTLSVLKLLDEYSNANNNTSTNVFTIFQGSIGYRGVEAIRLACVNAMLRVWLQVLSSWVLYGHDPELAIDFFGNEPFVFLPLNLPESTGQLIYTTGGIIHQLSSEGTKSSRIFKTNLELLRESYLEELNKLQAPVHSFQIVRLLSGIRRDIILKTGSQHFSHAALTSFFQVLRSVVLFGNTLFADEFAKELPKCLRAGNVVLFPGLEGGATTAAQSNRRLQRKLPLHQALSDTFQRTLKFVVEDANCSETERDTFVLAQSMLSLDKISRSGEQDQSLLFLGKLTGIPIELSLKISNIQEAILQTKTTKKLYLGIFSFLASLRMSLCLLTSLWMPEALRQTNTRAGLHMTAFKAKAFLDVLWEYFESSVIDHQFAPLFYSLKTPTDNSSNTVDPDEICQKHNAIILKIYDMLLLRSEKFAQLMGDLMLDIKILHSTASGANNSPESRVNLRMLEIYKCIEDIQLSDDVTSKMGLRILLLRIDFVKDQETEQ